jgi:hypothetical protein
MGCRYARGPSNVRLAQRAGWHLGREAVARVHWGVSSTLATRSAVERLARHARLSVVERIALIERLRDEGLASFMRTQGMTRSEAIRRIKATHRAGRAVSASAIGRDD